MNRKQFFPIEDAIDAEKIEHVLENEEFENWSEAKKDLMKHFGFTENDIQHKHIKKS